MFKLFSNISITFKQICIFKTSVIAEITIYRFQAVSILKFLPYTDYAYTRVCLWVYTIEDEKRSRMNSDFLLYIHSKIICDWVFLHSFAFFHYTKKQYIFFENSEPVKNRSYKHSSALNLFSIP